MNTTFRWAGHWYDLSFENYEEDPIALDRSGNYLRYNPKGYIEYVNYSQNRRQYELIQNEYARELEQLLREDEIRTRREQTINPDQFQINENYKLPSPDECDWINLPADFTGPLTKETREKYLVKRRT